MNANFTNFTSCKTDADLSKCSFLIPLFINKKARLLDTIFDIKNVPENIQSQIFSYESVLKLDCFFKMKNKGTCSKSEYKTALGFLNRIKKEIKK